MWRKVAWMAPVSAMVLGGLWPWHGGAVAQSPCIHQCVPNEVCYGSSELECWGCAPGSMNYSCQNQMGRKDWWNDPTSGSTNTGSQAVQYNYVPCWWKTRCASRFWPKYSCSGAGICIRDPPSPEGCSDCIIAEGSFYDIHYYVNAVCSACPSGS